MALVCCLLASCSSQPENNSVDLELAKDANSVQQKMLQVHQQWQGTPYRLGGTNKAGVDCSAFVQHLYIDVYNKTLPRTTELQLSQGTAVSLSQVQTGDLIFFKTSYKVRHVGVVYDQNHFLHASTSKGVIFSRIDNVYWAPRIIAIKRL
ncbi:NlpC/P60 family protein [Agarivorans aestuarii]|uniref:NlpC/P60 family protein n=1 Tax=Agarivorans aestuarii TaxID=1563703 RepID=A0ABU7GAA7_9ALTE|nr:NlpC/P60 family protein [Agarivorans aestuarii]MEE1676347.1 NlpC/P60 family protein [Agarivorans aestuarii]